MVYLNYNGNDYTYEQVIESIKQDYDDALEDNTFINKSEAAFNIADNAAVGFALAKLEIKKLDDWCFGTDEIKEKVGKLRDSLRIAAIGE